MKGVHCTQRFGRRKGKYGKSSDLKTESHQSQKEEHYQLTFLIIILESFLFGAHFRHQRATQA